MSAYFTCKLHLGRGQTDCFYCWARDNEEQIVKMVKAVTPQDKEADNG